MRNDAWLEPDDQDELALALRLADELDAGATSGTGELGVLLETFATLEATLLTEPKAPPAALRQQLLADPPRRWVWRSLWQTVADVTSTVAWPRMVTQMALLYIICISLFALVPTTPPSSKQSDVLSFNAMTAPQSDQPANFFVARRDTVALWLAPVPEPDVADAATVESDDFIYFFFRRVEQPFGVGAAPWARVTATMLIALFLSLPVWLPTLLLIHRRRQAQASQTPP